MSALRL